jgi:hypothetical protein
VILFQPLSTQQPPYRGPSLIQFLNLARDLATHVSRDEGGYIFVCSAEPLDKIVFRRAAFQSMGLIYEALKITNYAKGHLTM